MLTPILVLTGLVVARGATAMTCYYPNGDEQNDHAPCPGVTEENPGACCNVGDGFPHTDDCMSNGYCYSVASGRLYRGSCTDMNWNAPGCAQNCQSDNPGSDITVSSCVNYNNYAMCCGSIMENGDTCCNNTNALFYWDNGYVLINSSTIDAAQTNTSNTTTGTTTTVTASSPALISGFSPPSQVAQGAVIGVGIGLGLPLLIALAALAYMYFVWRPKILKENHALAMQTEKSNALPGSGPGSGAGAGGPATPAPTYYPTYADQRSPQFGQGQAWQEMDPASSKQNGPHEVHNEPFRIEVAG